MSWLRIKLWIRTRTPALFFLVLTDLIGEGLDRLPKCVRGRLCWLLKHKYRGIWFKSDNPDAYAGIADTEAGCVFCGDSKPNEHFMDPREIDYEKTKHRSTPPKHKVLRVAVSE